MPKPITLEMLQAMSPDQRKTLQRNAQALDTPAAQAVLELLTKGDWEPVKPAAAAPKKKAAPAARPKKAKAAATVNPVQAVHGRRA